MNVDCSSISCYPAKRLKKEESVSRVNSRIVLVCCTILTYVHNYANIVTVDYLLSYLVKLVRIYSFCSFFQYYQLFWYWWIKDYQLLGRLWRAIPHQCLCPTVASASDLLLSVQEGNSSPLLIGPCLLWPNGRPSQLLLSTC